MKKIILLCLCILISIVTMHISFSKWSDELQIGMTINTINSDIDTNISEDTPPISVSTSVYEQQILH